MRARRLLTQFLPCQKARKPHPRAEAGLLDGGQYSALLRAAALLARRPAHDCDFQFRLVLNAPERPDRIRDPLLLPEGRRNEHTQGLVRPP